ncbi:MAG: hypothetical protein AB7F89_14510 [Pirellulaceae bacterium]
MGQLISAPEPEPPDDVPIIKFHPSHSQKDGYDDDSPADESPAHEPLIQYDWIEDDPAAKNYRAFGERLTQAGDLFRRPGYGNGLVLVLPNGEQVFIKSAADLAPVIADRVALSIYLDGKPKGSKLSQAHMNAMLKSEAFLGQFLTVDRITTIPRYLPDFRLTMPGFNDGGECHRYLYLGPPPLVLDTLDRINAFLDVMAFASKADRTNAVGAALTVMLRDLWPGGKAILLVTATKSHAGKDTVIAFASGVARQCSISYQSTNWALERCFVGVLNHEPDAAVVVIENARLDRRDSHIASAFLERFATDPEPFLFSTGTGPASRRRNDILLAISTNFGTVSEDLLNRSLPIHLNPVGNVGDRVSPIGNPKLEFLPQNRGQIAGELRGMIERWKAAGMPLDRSVRHPFTNWAQVIGGILKVNGFHGFLANYGTRRVADDPLRQGLGLLGVATHGNEWKRPDFWARETAKLGLVKQIIPSGDQDGGEARKRGIGVVLSNHRGEVFDVETETERLRLTLEKKRGRHGEADVHVRYRFVVTQRESLLEKDESE